MRRILHLVGSPTSQFWADLSLVYARGALGALGSDHDFVNLVVMPDGTWRFAEDLSNGEIEAAPPCKPGEAIDRVLEMRPDCVLPQMFCHRGMVDYRAMFEGMGLPLLGNRAEVMAICADKALTKSVINGAGIATPRSETLKPGDTVTMTPPFIVKPAIADNSEGITLVEAEAQVAIALEQAFARGSRAIVEAYIAPGREVRAGVVEIDGDIVALPLEEYRIDRQTRPIRRAEDKLSSAPAGGLKLMAKTAEEAWIVPEDDPLTQRVQRVALACHHALGCRDYSLFDFRIDDAGRPWFLEAGPYCSFAPDSVLVTMMEAKGHRLSYFFADAVDRIAARND